MPRGSAALAVNGEGGGSRCRPFLPNVLQHPRISTRGQGLRCLGAVAGIADAGEISTGVGRIRPTHA